MSKDLMDTEAGGEQTQYEGEYTDVEPHKKSGGQMGDTQSTTNPSETDESAQQHAEQGERKAENIRYGQNISEGGMGGMTSTQEGEAGQEGYGKMKDEPSSGDAAEGRQAAGYGGEKDMDREIGA